MSERPFFPIPLREGALGITFAGLVLVAVNGARGPGAMLGFGLFCLGMTALDALHRQSVGFRHAALFLGMVAAGLGLWAALATGLMVLLVLPVPPELRTLLVTAAVCAAGSATAALLAVRSPEWLRGEKIRGWLRKAGKPSLRKEDKPKLSGFNRPSEPPHDRGYDAGQPLQQAGQAPGG